MPAPIGIKIPLMRDERNGYVVLDNYRETVKQNLKCLLLTSPGERVMIPEFGVGIRHYLFELKNKGTYSEIETAIREQAKKYMPYLNLQKVSVKDGENNDIYLKIVYFIIPLGMGDSLEINV